MQCQSQHFSHLFIPSAFKRIDFICLLYLSSTVHRLFITFCFIHSREIQWNLIFYFPALTQSLSPSVRCLIYLPFIFIFIASLMSIFIYWVFIFALMPAVSHIDYVIFAAATQRRLNLILLNGKILTHSRERFNVRCARTKQNGDARGRGTVGQWRPKRR